MDRKDFGIVIICLFAIFLALQKEGEFSFEKAWYHPVEFELEASPYSPAPIVADLNGDGSLEVLVVHSTVLKVLKPHPGIHEAREFSTATQLAEVQLTGHKQTGRSKQVTAFPVAIQTGYIDPPGKELVRAARKQIIVVLTSDSWVQAYDHNLQLLWEYQLHEQLPRHYHIKEAAIHISNHTVHTHDRGIVVVGTSFQLGIDEEDAEDDYDEYDEEEQEAEMAEELTKRKKHEEFNEEDYDYADEYAEDDTEEDATDGQEQGTDGQQQGTDGQEQGRKLLSVSEHAPHTTRKLTAKDDRDEYDMEHERIDVAQHFAMWAFNGGDGSVRWKNEPQDYHRDTATMKEKLLPQHNYRISAQVMESPGFTEVSCRDYRESILQVLPHKWSDLGDTQFTMAHFVKHKYAKGQRKHELAKRKAIGKLEQTNPNSHPADPSLAGQNHQNMLGWLVGSMLSKNHPPHDSHIASTKSKGVKEDKHHKHGLYPGFIHGPPNVLVAHLEEGLQVVNMFNGKPVCTLHLPAGGIHADINADGVPEHVQASDSDDDTNVHAFAHSTHGRLPGCWAWVLAGVPPNYPMWNMSVCRQAPSLSAFQFDAAGEGESSKTTELLTPVVLPISPHHTKPVHHQKRQQQQAVFLNSKGLLTSIASHGNVKWQKSTFARWDTLHQVAETGKDGEVDEAITVATLAAMPLRAGLPPDVLLAVGDQWAGVYTHLGQLVESVELPYAPVQPVEMLDFNGDGFNDLVVVTDEAVFGFVQVKHPGGVGFSSLVVVLMVTMGVMYFQYQGWGAVQGVGGRVRKAMDRID